MIGAVTIFLVGVLAAAVGQVLLKLGAVRGRGRPLLASFLDPYIASGYLLMLSSTVTSTLALKVLPLRMAVALLPIGFIVVALLSVVVLHERLRRQQVVGMLIILAGVLVFNLEAL